MFLFLFFIAADVAHELRLSEEFCTNHFLVGLLLSLLDECMTESRDLRRKVICILRNLLAKHSFDQRYKGKVKKVARFRFFFRVIFLRVILGPATSGYFVLSVDCYFNWACTLFGSTKGSDAECFTGWHVDGDDGSRLVKKKYDHWRFSWYYNSWKIFFSIVKRLVYFYLKFRLRRLLDRINHLIRDSYHLNNFNNNRSTLIRFLQVWKSALKRFHWKLQEAQEKRRKRANLRLFQNLP